MPPEINPQDQDASPTAPAMPPEGVPSMVLEPKPAMRTMRSDMEGVFYANKPPALIQFMQKEDDGAALKASGLLTPYKFGKRPLVFIVVIILILGVGGAIGFFFFPTLVAKIPGIGHIISSGTPPPREPAVAPAPFFSTESTEELVVTANNPVLFLEALDHAAKKTERQGTIRRLLIKLADERGEYYANLTDLFDRERITPPPHFLDNTEGPLMAFFAATASGERFGLVVRVMNSDRAVQDLRLWETGLATDFQPLMFTSELTATTTAFTSGTYRNIDWRFLKRSEEQDLGIGYALFPARNYIVFTTSARALETVIDRLFEAR